MLQSLRGKAFATIFSAAGLWLLFQAITLDSQNAARQTGLRDASIPVPGERLTFTATAYCKGSTTTSGVAAQRGVAAADPDILPVGSVIDIDAAEPEYNGIYTVMDTGPLVQGRRVDLYMWSCNEALQFGRKSVRLTVLRLGWHPKRSTSPRDFRPNASAPASTR